MEHHNVAEMTPPESNFDTPGTEEESPAVVAASVEYLGRWNRLVSTTNWEKGHIIGQWRTALVAAGAPAAAYTDEAWSRRVGNLTPQHAGRLRRVAQRFGAARDAYPGLYWSHFQAALDWDDAEMWLEGAVQNGWSIATMQNERARTFGDLAEASHSEPVEMEMDDDAPLAAAQPEGPADTVSGSMAEVHDIDDRDEGDEPANEFSADAPFGDAPPDDAAAYADEEPAAVRPFEKLPPLPADLHDAFESFKLAIIHHRIAAWREVSCDDVLTALYALRQLAEAPLEA